MNSTQNWKHYQHQLTKYIDLLSNNSNPFTEELTTDFRRKKVDRLVSSCDDSDFKSWIKTLIESGTIDERTIDIINVNFSSFNSLKYFTKILSNNYKVGEVTKLISAFDEDALVDFKVEHKDNIPRLKFNPTQLKFVTTTAIAYLDTNVDFKLLYERYKPYDNILKDSSEHIYHDNMIGKIVGCKTGSSPRKGVFKKEIQGDFYNCASLNVVINATKDANVKIFNNGKLQMTGIPKIEEGKKVCGYICNLLKAMSDAETSDEENPIVYNKKRIVLKTYKTVMINTCYEIGHCIDRETLYKIILNRYNLNAIFDSEGYPGVRIEYYYNTNNIGHDKQGKCICPKTCTGKGAKATGEGEGRCRKISIAIFQSGSTIIAGGCKDEKPIYIAYNFINNILKQIIGEVAKPENLTKKMKKKNLRIKYIEKTNITNNNLYAKLLSYATGENISLEIKPKEDTKVKKNLVIKKSH